MQNNISVTQTHHRHASGERQFGPPEPELYLGPVHNPNVGSHRLERVDRFILIQVRLLESEPV